MGTELYPLRFRAITDVRVWGREIKLISGLPGDSTEVANGPLAGATLAELTDRFGKELVGDKFSGGVFPLLFKEIAAEDKLSVQVHPHVAMAGDNGERGDPKTEMWHVLEGRGTLYMGFSSAPETEEIRALSQSGGIAGRLAQVVAAPGDAFLIPGGLVHSIGAGLTIYEVQQSSDTTYRFYDWDRRGPDGRGRELHIESALKAIRPRLPPPTRRTDIACRHFKFRKTAADGTLRIAPNPETFTAVYLPATRESILVPAACGAEIPCRGEALVTTL